MARSSAETVEAYLAELSDEDRAVVEEVRRTVLDRLPDGYVETMRWGMITYEVPLEISGPTYNGQPLMYAAVARQSRHFAVYLSGPWSDPDGALEDFRAAYRASGRELDMGKSCVRFRDLDDVPLDVLGDEIARLPVDEFVGIAERAHA